MEKVQSKKKNGIVLHRKQLKGRIFTHSLNDITSCNYYVKKTRYINAYLCIMHVFDNILAKNVHS